MYSTGFNGVLKIQGSDPLGFHLGWCVSSLNFSVSYSMKRMLTVIHL